MKNSDQHTPINQSMERTNADVQSIDYQFIGEIRIFPFGFAPVGWIPCEGQDLPIDKYENLYMVIGNRFGGDSDRFRLPDLREKVLLSPGDGFTFGKTGGAETHVLTIEEMAAHTHPAIASSENRNVSTTQDHFWAADGSYRNDAGRQLHETAIGNTGNGQPHDNMAPFLSLSYCISLEGVFIHDDDMSNMPGTIKVIPAPSEVMLAKNWLPCDGRILPVNAYYADLYRVIGNTYGGDQDKTFRLPDLRGRACIGSGHGEGLSDYKIGDTGGAAEVTLSEVQLPPHHHTPHGSTTAQYVDANSTNVWANPFGRPAPDAYATSKGTGITMNPNALDHAGGDKAHDNMMPYMVMNFVIVTKQG